MNVKISLLCLSFCFAVVISMSIADSDDERWEDYKRKFQKTYKPENEPIRKANFNRNVDKINRHNEQFEKGKFSYQMNINQFTDMDPADYNRMQLDYGPEMYNISVYCPPSYDWREERKLSPVPDKGLCEQCDWAFATVGMLEGYLFREEEEKNGNKNKHLTLLSVQDLIECSGNDGCFGGAVNKSLDYVQEHGISTEDKYQFSEMEGNCKKTLQRKGIPKGKIIRKKEFKPSDEITMKYHIYGRSPIAATVSKQFLQYKAGEIFTGGNCFGDGAKENYNILIVGYGNNTSTSQEYWIVKNWMGEKWGEDGYAKVARGNSTNCEIFSNLIGITEINNEELN